MKKILLILLSLVLLLGLPAVSCRQQSTDTPTATGGVLNLYGIDPLTLDPAVAGDGPSNAYVIQPFSGLVRLDDNL